MKAEDHVGPGWAPVAQRAIDMIEDLGVDVMQVKEKFGGLRIYCGAAVSSDLYERVNAIVAEAERECSGLCEQCGAPGQLRTGGWLKTLCDEHAAKREARDG